MKLNGLEQYFETVNGKIIDFKQVDSVSKSPLMYAFYYNKSLNLNLIEAQFDYLIKNSDLKKVDKFGWSSLRYALEYNKAENLNLNNNQFDYLIKNSDLTQITRYGNTPLMFALKSNKEQHLNLEQWKYLIDNSDLSLITNDKQLMKLKKIQLELLNNEILSKIDIKEENKILKKI